MNKICNSQLPDFQEHHGQDWDAFKEIEEKHEDYFAEKLWLYNLVDIDRCDISTIEMRLQVKEIVYDEHDSDAVKRLKLRSANSVYKRKALNDVYAELIESLTGIAPMVASGDNLGSWKWGDARWGDGGTDPHFMRWSANYGSKDIYINPHTTDPDKIDAIVALLEADHVNPMFYKLVLIDDNFNVVREV